MDTQFVLFAVSIAVKSFCPAAPCLFLHRLVEKWNSDFIWQQSCVNLYTIWYGTLVWESANALLNEVSHLAIYFACACYRVVKKFKHGMQALILFKTLHACKVHPLHSLWLSHSFVQHQLGVLGNASHQSAMMLPSPTNSMNKISPTTQVA